MSRPAAARPGPVARLHVLLGEGGVGKTTLAAAYALALAEEGRHVALLSIDPARRLQTALGLALSEREESVPRASSADGRAGSLKAALLVPEATLRRWATEGVADDAERRRLLDNRLFRVLADRLAATTDVIAAVRVAEWLEGDPTLTDLVVDTAPGRNGMDFLHRPAALVALLEGRLVTWLRHLARGVPTGGARNEESGLAVRVLSSLGRIAGMDLLVELAQLVSVVETPFHRVLARLERAQAWLAEPETEILLVTAVREDALPTTQSLVRELTEARLSPAAILVNRAIVSGLEAELGGLAAERHTGEEAAVLRYVASYTEVQARVLAGLRTLGARVIPVAARRGLDAEGRLAALTSVGRELHQTLRGASLSEPLADPRSPGAGLAPR